MNHHHSHAAGQAQQSQQPSGAQSNAAITVIGGGIMGALTSLLAAQSGFKVNWFGPEESDRTDGAGARNYALSPLTVDLLKKVGVWAAIDSSSCKVAHMEVFTAGTRVDLSATDAGAEFLSVMVLHQDLLNALEQAVQFSPQINRIKARPDHISAGQEESKVLYNGEIFATQLIVGADGARSWVRQQSGILWGQRDYRQHGVVATLQTEHSHGGVAAQWFDQGEILAFLPLAHPNKVSIVWSTSREDVRAPSSALEFQQELEKRSNHRFGGLTLISEISSAPLRLLITEAQSALRTVLVGDSGHTVHPLAGYGLNLGVQDLLSLEELWRAHKDDPGANSLIQRYEKSRRYRVRRVQWGLDMLQRFVSQSHPTMSKIRRWGMQLVADIGPLRQFLIRQAISPQ